MLPYLNWIVFPGSESSWTSLSLRGIIFRAFSIWWSQFVFRALVLLDWVCLQKLSISSKDIWRKTSFSSSVAYTIRVLRRFGFWKNMSCIRITLAGRDSWVRLFIASHISVRELAQLPEPLTAFHLVILSFTTALACSTSLCVCGVCGHLLTNLMLCFFRNSYIAPMSFLLLSRFHMPGIPKWRTNKLI